MAKARTKRRSGYKRKKDEAIFESNENILKRIYGRIDADPYIVSPGYRIENITQCENLARQISDEPEVPELMREFEAGLKRAEAEEKEHALAAARQHYHDACTEDEYRKVQGEFAALTDCREAEELGREAASKADRLRRKTNTARAIRVTAVLAIAAALIWMWACGFFSYMMAWAEGKAGIYLSARNRFESLGDFLDSAEKADYYDQLLSRQEQEEEKGSLEDARPGDEVEFADLTWKVVGSDGSKLTLLLKSIDSDGVFGPTAYKEISDKDDGKSVTWADSSLREYLNTDALDAFSEQERSAMILQTHKPSSNSVYGTGGGRETEDLIRIPDAQEAQQFKRKGYYGAPPEDVWLCTPGSNDGTAVFWTKNGKIIDYGDDTADTLSIAAMITVDYTKLG